MLKMNDKILVNYYGEVRKGFVRKVRTWQGSNFYGEDVYYLTLDEPVNVGTILESTNVFIEPLLINSGKIKISKI